MIELRTLGVLQLRGCDPRAVDAVVSQPKRLGLLAYLAIATPPGFHRRDSLVALFWPESDQTHARGALRNALSFLRRQLGETVIVTRGDEVGLDPTTFWCDVTAFLASSDAGRAEEALALYQGDLLEGFHISDAPDFEQWLEGERKHLRATAAETAWALAGIEERAGNWVSAAGYARRAVALSPDYEQPACRLIELLDRGGDRAAALQEYETLERRLAEELEVPPSPETQSVIEAIRKRATPRSNVAARVAPPTVPPTAPAEPPGMAEPRLNAHHAVLLVIALFLLGGGWLLWRDGHLPANALSPTHIAVFPFTVRGSPESAYLGLGIVDLLSADLDGLGELRTVDSRAVLSRGTQLGGGSPHPRDFRAAAAKLGAGAYVAGDIVEVGDRLRISARLYTVDKREAAPVLATVEGSPTRLFELVDSLAGQLIAGRREVSGRGFAGLAAITTSSLPALKAYLAGENALRAGQHPAAIEAFQQATRLDTSFALAYYGLARAATWWRSSNPSVAHAASRRAYRYRDRVAWRARRLIEAFDARVHLRHAEAEHLYREIVARYPNQFDAWLGLGGILLFQGQFLGRSWADARIAYKQAAAVDQQDAHPLWFLTYIAAREGRLAELDSLTARVLELEPGAFAPAALVAQGQSAVLRGDTAEVERFVATIEGQSAERLQLTGGVVAWTTGDIAIGRRVWRLLADPSRPLGMRALARMTLAKLEVTAGRWHAAKAQLDSLQALDYSTGLEHRAAFALARFLAVPRPELAALRDTVLRWDATAPDSPDTTGLLSWNTELHPHLRLYLLGLLSARLGDSAAALSYARELQSRGPRSHAPNFVSDLSRVVRMEVAWVGGRLEEALSTLEGARLWAQLDLPPDNSPLLEWSYERFARAELLYQLGRWEEAARWYQPMVDLFVYAGGASALRLAQLHDRWAKPQEAKGYYARFLRWWQDCDPELRSRVDKARGRLAELR